MLRKLLIISGLMPLLGILSRPPSVMLFLYSIFILTYFYGQKKWQSFLTHGNKIKAIITTAILVLFFTETLAWFNNYFEEFKNPGALFSTNYFKNIVIGLGFYLGITFVWLLLNRFFFFTVAQAFITYGFFAIFLEQSGTVLHQAIIISKTNVGLSLLTILSVFLVHGSILGLIHMRVAPRSIKTHKTVWKYPIAIIVIWIGVSFGTVISGLLARTLFL